MLLNQLLESKQQIKNSYGVVKWNYKDDLEDEEHEGYIPDGYNKTVIELSYIEGNGANLMKAFLNSPDVKNAELIFLDPSPLFSHFLDMKEDIAIDKLVRFYSKFGFEYNPKSVTKRMWLVQKGSIPRNKLPT